MKRWKSLTAALCAAVLLCGFSAVPALSLIHISFYAAASERIRVARLAVEAGEKGV